jgi:hypothetical protein
MDESSTPTGERRMNADETLKRGNAMERSGRKERHGGILYPLLLAAAVAVIVFSIIGIATMTGVMPNASREAGRHSAVEQGTKSRHIDEPRRERPQHGNPRSAMRVSSGHV